MSLHSAEPTLRNVQTERSRAYRTRAARRGPRPARNHALEIGLKKVCDLTLAAITLVILLPALLVIAALIKADSSGPVLFRQLRYGRNQRPFVILKFRTMYPSSDGRQATRDDRRVTKVGRVLRRCSLDELPQILNVLRGDMSLVGPRPHALWHDEVFCDLIEGYRDRYLVKPGMTGLAQITGCRGETPTKSEMLRRVEKDLEYVEKQSFALDLKILLLTVPALFSLRNAY